MDEDDRIMACADWEARLERISEEMRDAGFQDQSLLEISEQIDDLARRCGRLVQ